jgi:hypothetical protein
MNATLLVNRFQSLPSKAQDEVADFVEFISMKYIPSIKKAKKKSDKPNGFSFNWEGAISDYKNQYSSVELQHKANEWRSI